MRTGLIIKSAIILSVLVMVPVSPAWGQIYYNHEALIDVDNNPATGGPVPVVQGVEPPHDELGIDYRVRARVDIVSQQVMGIYVTGWTGAHFMPVSSDLAVFPVGINVGLGGTDMVEFYAPRQDLGNPMGTVKVVYHSSIMAVNDYSEAFFYSLAEIPALSGWGVSALAAILGAAALLMLLKRRSALTSALLITLMVVGVAWAVTIAMDGQAGDWGGVPVAVTDVAGDSSIGDPNEDIRYGYITSDRNNIYFRVDIVNIQGPPPPP